MTTVNLTSFQAFYEMALNILKNMKITFVEIYIITIYENGSSATNIREYLQLCKHLFKNNKSFKALVMKTRGASNT